MRTLRNVKFTSFQMKKNVKRFCVWNNANLNFTKKRVKSWWHEKGRQFVNQMLLPQLHLGRGLDAFSWNTFWVGKQFASVFEEFAFIRKGIGNIRQLSL